jgi:DNA-binding MarR family transcriptional regulator
MPHSAHPCPHHHPEGDDSPAQQVFRALRTLTHLNMRHMSRALAGHELHPAQAGCLRMLATSDGITQAELADLLHVSRPSVTSMLHRLEASGLIRRESDEQDRRLTRIHLTEGGRALIDGLHSAHREMLTASVGTLTEAELHELARLLGILSDNIRTALADEDGDRS